jgi:hypothetical protein
MANISVADAQAWAELTKLTLSALDADLEAQVSTQVLSRIAQAYDVSGWTTTSNTPKLVKNIIAMTYVSWLYSRQYSEDETGSNEYAIRLLAYAETLILGIISGANDLDETPEQVGPTTVPLFYPTDASSALEPSTDDPSLGPAKFTMGTVW